MLKSRDWNISGCKQWWSKLKKAIYYPNCPPSQFVCPRAISDGLELTVRLTFYSQWMTVNKSVSECGCRWGAYRVQWYTHSVQLKYHGPMSFNKFFILPMSSVDKLLFLALTPTLPGKWWSVVSDQSHLLRRETDPHHGQKYSNTQEHCMYLLARTVSYTMEEFLYGN